MTEDKDIQTAQPKSTVEEVYQQILKDANEAIEIDGLPNSAVNKMRFSKPAAYAVKALALLNMQKCRSRFCLSVDVMGLRYWTMSGASGSKPQNEDVPAPPRPVRRGASAARTARAAA